MSSVDHGHENESAATPAEQIAVDGSVGSDTDTGAPTRTNSLNDNGLNYQHHARSNSAKKPTSFKALSVTKNFLAKAGTPNTPSAKANAENNATAVNGVVSGPPAPRPRLVAKSSGTKQPKGFGSRNGAGPDPMQVWNRNRAAPQHPPKHLTDEELKQQYGIHLATRIQADGDGKEAKWADIDDDEDDWAPETIEWNDGTKIDLSKNDTAALLVEQKAAEELARKRKEEEEKAKAAKAAAEKKPTTSVGPNATVLKPRSALPKPGTPLVLKTPTEKPTLVSKPASTGLTKSPWAPLPAVDRVPPIEINPPIQTSAPRLQPNGVQPSPAAESPLHPALEIAADSFKRGGPDSHRDSGGQLYNDKSGKYEPAAGGRRGSAVKRDGNFRAPSVLQRGGQISDTSAISEEGRAGQEDFENGARRKSSTFSADSEAQAKRQPLDKGRDFSEGRDSLQSQVIQSPSTPGPQLSASEPLKQDSRVPSAYRAGPGSGSGNAVGERDDVALQRQLMKEKREQAIKRRKDQEEREEAEKKERIRKKLESLGAAPEPEKKDLPAVTIEKRPAEAPMAENEEAEEKESVPEETKPPVEFSSKFPKSPPRPPAPSASGEPQQYGMMKVHASGPRDPLHQVQDTLAAEKVKIQAPVQKVSRHRFEPQPEGSGEAETHLYGEKISPPMLGQRGFLENQSVHRPQDQKVSPPGFEIRSQEEIGRASPILNGTLTPNKAEHLFSRSPELTNQRSTGDLRPQPWNEAPKEVRTCGGWNHQQLFREHNHVWGAPNQSRPFGNGTFDRTIQRPQSRPQDQYPSPALAPIGPPKHLQQAKDSRDSRSLHDASPITGFEDSQTVPSFPPTNYLPASRCDVQNRLTSGQQKRSSPQFPQGPHFEPQRTDSPHHLNGRDSASALLAWKDFPAAVAAKDAEERRQAQSEREARKAEEGRTGIAYQPQMNFKEKWSQVEVAEHGLGRKVTGVVHSLNTLGPSNAIHPSPEIRGPSFINSTDLSHTIPGGLGRGSRFFPTAGRLQSYQQSHAPFAPYHRCSDSPPPPETEAHPAHILHFRRPIVRLPPGDEQRTPRMEVKVRLPPSVTTPVQSPQPAPAQLSLRPTLRPLVNNPSWQERINSMLGTRLSPEKSPRRSVSQQVGFSATKEPLDLPLLPEQAAVTLPPHGETRTEMCAPAPVEAAAQESQDEEALFEPEAGSTPAIRFPASLGHPAWQDKSLKRYGLRSLPSSSEVDAVTKQSLALPALFSQQDMLMVFVNLQGMPSQKSVSMQPPPNYTPPAKKPHIEETPTSQHYVTTRPRQQGKGYRSRELSGNSGTNSPKTGHKGYQKSARSKPHNSYHRNPHIQDQRSNSQRKASCENVGAT